MNKLMSANLSRLKKNKVFRGCVILTLFIGVLITLMRFNRDKKFAVPFTLETTLFSCSITLAILLAVFCSLFLATEFSDGTIRNKIIAGHSRLTIYFSYLVTNIVVAFIFCTLYFLVNMGLGLVLGGTFQVELRYIIALILNVCILTIAYSSIFTMIAMLKQKKSMVAVICILSTLVLFLIGTFIYSKLEEPEMIPAYTSTNGSPVYDVDTPNPAYIDGMERETYKFLYDFLPGGQTVQYISMQISSPYKLSLYSSIIVIVNTMIGVLFFLKKDLK